MDLASDLDDRPDRDATREQGRLRAAGRTARVVAAGLFAVAAVAVAASSRPQMHQSTQALLQGGVDEAAAAAEVKHVLQTEGHPAVEQGLAFRNAREQAWHGIGDQVVRQFDHVFGSHASTAARRRGGVAKATVKGAKHETDKGNFLLKMGLKAPTVTGLVLKGGHVQDQTEAKASAVAHSEAASRPGAVARTAAQREMRKLASSKHPALHLTRLAEMRSETAPAATAGVKLAATAVDAKAAAGMDAAVQAEKALDRRYEQKLDAPQKQSEGLPQATLPATAVAQTRQAVADTLGNVFREAVRAEHLYDDVSSNMQTLHMAISHVEDVVGPHGLLAGEAPGSGEESVSGAAMLTGKTSNAPQIADVMQRRAMDATRMARLRAAMMLNPERRRRVVEGARAQASLNDDRPGSESARPAGDGFAADELLLWSHAPEPSQASDARASRGLASVEASLSRLSAKFSRQAQHHAA